MSCCFRRENMWLIVCRTIWCDIRKWMRNWQKGTVAVSSRQNLPGNSQKRQRYSLVVRLRLNRFRLIIEYLSRMERVPQQPIWNVAFRTGCRWWWCRAKPQRRSGSGKSKNLRRKSKWCSLAKRGIRKNSHCPRQSFQKAIKQGLPILAFGSRKECRW